MFHVKDHKTDYLFEPFGYMGSKRLKRIKESWAGLFQKEILRELPVEELMRHYDPAQGRPSKEMYAVLGAVLLQQMMDLTDEETIDNFAFNLQWHYALNVTDESDKGSYLCSKTLWTMRTMVMQDSVAPIIFDRITHKLKSIFEVNTEQQRLDSMHIFSNMRHLGRVGLIAQTLRKFLVNLKRQDREEFAAVPEEVRERYMPKRGKAVFALVKPSEAERTLRTLGKDLFELIERFRKHGKIREMNSYGLLVRVFSEQFQVETSDGESRILINEKVSCDSLQNPSDPDATYDGHKGKGYQVQVLESYSKRKEGDEEAPPLNLITYVEAQPAHEHDTHTVKKALEKTRQENRAPSRILADSLYGGDDNHVDCQDEGVELIAPVKTNKPCPNVGLANFSYGAQNWITECPMGHAPISNYHRKDRHSAWFDSDLCLNCPLREECPVKRGGKGHFIRYSNKELRLELRKAYEQTPEFREHYRYRSGSEATMSELDRKTGIKNLRVRGMEAVSLCVFLKATGLNIFRAARVRNRKTQPLGWAQRLLPTLCRVRNSGQKAFQHAFASLGSRIVEMKVCFGETVQFRVNFAN
ncbi:MAG: transposase [Anaerolineales bacterium]|nr:transposase [Anaerolineales bacterium]